MRIFKDAWFSRFARKQGISDETLKDAVTDLENGLWEANLGGDVYKKRIARQGDGKSGSYRVIVIFKSNERTFFVYGFLKSDRSNIEEGEEAGFKERAKDLLSETEEQIEARIKRGNLREII